MNSSGAPSWLPATGAIVFASRLAWDLSNRSTQSSSSSLVWTTSPAWIMNSESGTVRSAWARVLADTAASVAPPRACVSVSPMKLKSSSPSAVWNVPVSLHLPVKVSPTR